MGKRYNYIEAEKLLLKGVPIREISRKLGIDRTAMTHYFVKNNFILPKHNGKNIEDLIEKYFKSKKMNVVRQKESCHFDLLVNDKKIDVKSASITKSDGKNHYRYIFQLADYTERKTIKNFENEINKFIFVFLDNQKNPFYSISPEFIKNKSSISFPLDIKKSKYYLHLKFVNFLEGVITK